MEWMILCLIAHNILYIGSSWKLCNTAYECANDVINIGSDGVQVRGYKAASGNGSVTTSGQIRCEASHSCQTLLTATNTNDYYYIELTGSQAAYNTTISSKSYIDCIGWSSCSHSTISAVKYIRCSGDHSCSFSSILETKTIHAYGAYSLRNTTINSSNIDKSELAVNFQGYRAGFGSRVVCQSNHNCSINCWADACNGLILDCQGNNNCNIYYQYPTLNTSFQFLYYSLEIDDSRDNACNQIDAISYDDYSEHYQSNPITVDGNSVSALCCRGRASCRESNKLQYDSSNGNFISCGGTSACFWTDIYNDGGDVYCEGDGSCALIEIQAETLYCLGQGSCMGWFMLYPITARTVFCTGANSCSATNISSYGDGGNLTVYFMGVNARFNVSIHCQKNDFCRIVDSIPYPDDYGSYVLCDGECVVECPRNWTCIKVITPNPTNAPSHQTSVPTDYPSIYPTESTMNPTQSTVNIIQSTMDLVGTTSVSGIRYKAIITIPNLSVEQIDEIKGDVINIDGVTKIISSQVDGDTITLQIAVDSDLDTTEIQQKILEALVDKYPKVTVDIEGDDNADVDSDDTDSETFSVYSMEFLFIIIGSAAVCICLIVAVAWKLHRNKSARKSQINSFGIAKIASISGVHIDNEIYEQNNDEIISAVNRTHSHNDDVVSTINQTHGQMDDDVIHAVNVTHGKNNVDVIDDVNATHDIEMYGMRNNKINTYGEGTSGVENVQHHITYESDHSVDI